MNENAGPVPPRTPYEEAVADIWRDILGRSDIGVLDDFFDLGGHSLLAVQVVVRIRKIFSVDIPVKDFFESPVVASLAGIVAAAHGRPPGRREVAPAPPDAEPVLSLDQQRLWLESQLRPAAAYNVHGRRRLLGHLQAGALDGSIRAVLGRHEALRTRFPLVDGRPVPIVDEPDEQWQVSFADVSGTTADRAGVAARLADEQAAAPFDLARGPLFRCLLIRLGPAEHLLSITLHHIVSDAWSVSLFLREIAALYVTGGDPEAAKLPPLPVQYRDYSAWQRTWLAGEDLRGDLDYWGRELSGAPVALSLPEARRRSPSQGAVGGRAQSSLPEAETAALRALCRQHGVTLFMALLAALAALLRRWSGQQDLVIGAPVATRNDAGTSRLIGLFVNTLALRVDLSGEPDFSELLRRVRRVALDGYAHGEAPFDRVVQEVKTPRDPTRTPIFQVVLNMIDVSAEITQISGLSVETVDSPVLPSKIDLMLNVRESGATVQFDLAFHGDRYDAAIMRLLLRQLRVLLAAVAADPARNIVEYSLRDPDEADEAGGPGAEFRPEVAARPVALRSSDRLAVIDGTGHWTYRQLSLAVGQVTDRLARQEAAQKGRVGVLRRRTAGFAATILGCVRAGVAFSVVGTAVARPGISMVLDPDDVGAPPGTGGELGPAGAGPARRAGAPEERADQLDDWAVERFSLSADDRFAVLSGTAGHIAAALRTAVAAGATVLIPDDAVMTDPGALPGWLRDHAVSVVYLSPPLLRAMAAREPAGDLAALRYAVIDNSGELTYQDVGLLTRMAPSCRMVSLYGTSWAGLPLAVYAVPPGRRPEASPLRVPIGTFRPGAPAELAGPAGAPTAPGELGEIRIAGQPTGDLARRLPDGGIELAGGTVSAGTAGAPEADLAEIVATLRDLPGVADAIATWSLGTDGRRACHAYAARGAPAPSRAVVRQYLRSQLPEYLVPEQLVMLDRLPLTPDGNYDLAALPVVSSDDDAADEYMPPRTPAERQLTDIFEELLDVDRVGVHDTLFELNGFSLLATRLAARIRETFRCDLALRDVFESPTVAGLAQLIVAAQAELAGIENLDALLAEIEQDS